MKSEIKAVCFDLDETLINHNSWLTLGLALGVTKERDQELYDEFKAGKITYEEWNDRVLSEYMKHEDATREGVTRIFGQYVLSDGAQEAVSYLQGKNYEIILISGSIDILVHQVAHDLGISYAKANNTFEFDDDERLVNIRSHGNDTLAKAEHLESFCDLLGITMQECACIADGANDIEMFRRTGRGVTFRGSPIEQDAWKIIDSLHDIQEIF
jgi:phosphoserine phosphatase